MAYVDPRILAGMSQASLSKYNLMRALSSGIQTSGNMANFGANQTGLRPGEENPLGSPDFGDEFVRGRNAARAGRPAITGAGVSATPEAIAAPQAPTPYSLVASTYGIARGQNADPLPDAHAVLRDFKKIGAGYGDLPTVQGAGSAGAYGGRTDKRTPGWYGAADNWADGTPIDENNQWMTGIVQGPGGPKDDKVGPAMLSDGEAAVPAKTVNYLNDAMGDPNGMAKLIYGTDTAPKNPDVRAEQVAKVGGAEAVKSFMAKQAGQPSVVKGKVVQKFADGWLSGAVGAAKTAMKRPGEALGALTRKASVLAPIYEGAHAVASQDPDAQALHALSAALGAGAIYSAPAGTTGVGAIIPGVLGAGSLASGYYANKLDDEYDSGTPAPQPQKPAAIQQTAPVQAPPRSPLGDLGITRQAGGGAPSFTYDAATDTTPAAVPGQAALNAYTQALQARDTRIQKLGAKSAALGDSGDVFNAEPTHIATLRELATLQGGDSLDSALGGVGGVGGTGTGGAGGKSRSQQVLDFAKGVQDMNVSKATAEENKAKLRNEENKYVATSLTDAEKPLAAKYASVMAGNTTAEAKIQALRDLAALEKAGILTDPDAPHTLSDREMLQAIQRANQAQGNSNIKGEGVTSFMWGKRSRQQGSLGDRARAMMSPFGKNIPLTVGDRNAGTLVRPLDRDANEALLRLLSATSK